MLYFPSLNFFFNVHIYLYIFFNNMFIVACIYFFGGFSEVPPKYLSNFNKKIKFSFFTGQPVFFINT